MAKPTPVGLLVRSGITQYWGFKYSKNPPVFHELTLGHVESLPTWQRKAMAAEGRVASFLSRLGGSGCSMATPSECPGLPDDGLFSADSSQLAMAMV